MTNIDLNGETVLKLDCIKELKTDLDEIINLPEITRVHELQAYSLLQVAGSYSSNPSPAVSNQILTSGFFKQSFHALNLISSELYQKLFFWMTGNLVCEEDLAPQLLQIPNFYQVIEHRALNE